MVVRSTNCSRKPPRVGGRSDGGSSFVRLVRIAETVDPLNFNFGNRDCNNRDGIAP